MSPAEGGLVRGQDTMSAPGDAVPRESAEGFSRAASSLSPARHVPCSWPGPGIRAGAGPGLAAGAPLPALPRQLSVSRVAGTVDPAARRRGECQSCRSATRTVAGLALVGLPVMLRRPSATVIREL